MARNHYQIYSWSYSFLAQNLEIDNGVPTDVPIDSAAAMVYFLEQPPRQFTNASSKTVLV